VIPAVAALSGALLCGPATASELSVSPYATGYAEQVIDVDDFDYDSDWQPADSPIQVRLVIHAGNTISIDMLGDAVYDWSDGTVVLEGQPELGSYELDLGLGITSSLRFDLMGIEWEGELGEPIDFTIYDLVGFEPYLLPGNPSSPLDVTTEVEKQNVVEYDAIDIYVAAATLRVDISGSLNTWFETALVELVPLGVDGGVAQLVVHAEPQPLALPDVEAKEWADATAQLTGDIVFTPDLHAWPSVVVEIFGTEYTLAEFDIPIELPSVEDTWIFGPAELSFQRPEPPEPQDTGSAADTGEDDPDGKEPRCGCGTPGAGGAGLAWLLLGLVALRRRPEGRA
jgi:MYXO-CTERM domain-containing protein